MWFECAKRWYRMWMFCSCFYWFFACIQKLLLEVYLDNCVYKIANKQMTDYLDEICFQD